VFPLMFASILTNALAFANKQMYPLETRCS
jgi:hypothetical protein